MLDAAEPGATYSWQDGSGGSGYLVTQAGSYSVVVDLNGCTANDVIEVDYLSPGSVELGADASICPGSSLLLDATTAGATYLWQNGSTGPTLNVASAGQYWVQVSLGGCSESDSIDVSVTPLAPVELGPDTTLCNGSSIVLQVVPGAASVLWSDGSTGSQLEVTSSGTYTVQLSLGWLHDHRCHRRGCPQRDRPGGSGT
jgi:hypothetical protein